MNGMAISRNEIERTHIKPPRWKCKECWLYPVLNYGETCGRCKYVIWNREQTANLASQQNRHIVIAVVGAVGVAGLVLLLSLIL